MARKRKNRTHLKGAAKDETNDPKAPKSFVIKSGHVGTSVAQLVRDIRKIMEPNTASRLKERASARLRDYLTMAPALNVTHLLVLTLSPQTASLHMRVARLPAGPTLTFKVERYSLMKDLSNAKTKNVGHAPSLGEFRTPPLLVLSNFNPAPGEKPQPQLKLMSSMFQGMFPPIQIDKSALPSFRRVLLISYHAPTHLISIRHYIISIRPTGVSRRLRRTLESSTNPQSFSRPVDLSNDNDISDYLLRAQQDGYETGSETEGESEGEGSEGENGMKSGRVELPADYVGRGNKKGTNKAVRLVEVGPRMECKLVKVVEGIVGSLRGEGETVFHEFVHKTAAERSELKTSHAQRQKEKAARRSEQAANVARKKEAAEKAAAAKTSKRGKRPDAADANPADGEESEDELVHDYSGEDEFEFEDRLAAKATKKSSRSTEAGQPEDEDVMEESDAEDEVRVGGDEPLDFDEEDEAGDVSSSEDEAPGGEDGESSESDDEVDRPAAVKQRFIKKPRVVSAGKTKGRIGK
ncbi:RNA-binding protein required for 60S ribosomal subunit biogenesis [Phaffia rhodozyma]|uniref:RNA-binding protein required for 60S ribosomal subunit biogenesis n=1 Tax=Phaffia rhodozyma TaxID=264483 RepID=A0A0F7SNL9_PHARH|nr:RNA-binding protein required for 60S ribosomal subunit biogenesis [Phaffia rhodozyma]